MRQGEDGAWTPAGKVRGISFPSTPVVVDEAHLQSSAEDLTPAPLPKWQKNWRAIKAWTQTTIEKWRPVLQKNWCAFKIWTRAAVEKWRPVWQAKWRAIKAWMATIAQKPEPEQKVETTASEQPNCVVEIRDDWSAEQTVETKTSERAITTPSPEVELPAVANLQPAWQENWRAIEARSAPGEPEPESEQTAEETTAMRMNEMARLHASRSEQEPTVETSASECVITTPSHDVFLPTETNLQPCPDCRREVSRRAESCPHCGSPINKTIAETRLTVARPDQHNWALRMIQITLDGRVVFSLRIGDVESVPITPGRHTVTASITPFGTSDTKIITVRAGTNVRLLADPCSGFFGTMKIKELSGIVAGM
ncbi:MAG: hypothetical protein HZA46_09885 [Planctomycetales bacterium]|nr:hypothetical protein [Planctomycetales bacterium]